jgi:VWFA-related protein
MQIYFSPSNARVLLVPVLLSFAVLLQTIFSPSPAPAQDAPASPTNNSPDSFSTQPQARADSGQRPPGSPTTLKVRVNVVSVPVVVRDSSGHAVGNLQKENFEIFDNRKPQEITQFTIERVDHTDRNLSQSLAAQGFQKNVIPDKFTALLFDDVHGNFGNLPQLQAAGSRFVATGLSREERLGIFTTSGKVTVDFTDDRAALQAGLRKLRPNPLPGSRGNSCPTLTHYSANLIVNRHDAATTQAALGEVSGECGVKDPKVATAMVRAAADRILALGDMETNLALKTLSDVVSRLSTLPGQRTIALASPSFLVSDSAHRENLVIDRAVRSHVIISTLDTRGVYTEGSEIADENVLSEFADGTGGNFFRNNNDLDEGLRRVASPPEFVYQLGFYPKDLQEDGKYHHLKVKIVGIDKLSVSAREGYFAPTAMTDSKQAENSAITEALYSQTEIHDLPIRIQTQFVRDDKPIAKLSVRTFVDLQDLPHRQTDGKNTNELRMVAAIFDRNGKYIGAIDRKVMVQWSDDKAGTQTAATFSFLLDFGAYRIRLVARDAESKRLFAQASVIQIP